MKDKLVQKWLKYAVGGILLIGTGLSVVGESIIKKSEGAIFWEWFIWGTIGLAIIMSGLSIFGQAVVFKSFIDRNNS